MIISALIFLFKILIGVLLLLLVIAFLVFIHELGHFTAAKLLGVRVNEFALGFGKTLWQKKKGETTYKVNLLPLGGYVSLEGETYEPGTKGKLAKNNFQKQPLWGKAIILMAGIFMNIVFAIIFLAGYLVVNNYRIELAYANDYQFVGIESQKMSNGVFIQKILENSPAEGLLHEQDLVISLNGDKIYSQEQFLSFLDENQGKEVEVEVINQESLLGTDVLKVKLGERKEEGDLVLGAQYSLFNYQFEIKYPDNIGSAVVHTWNIFAYQISIFSKSFSVAVETGDASVPLDQVTSVVGVGVILSQLLFNLNISEIVNIVALVSISLAFFNLLPLSILDGGQLFIYVIEALIRKPINRKLLDRINQITFVLLILLSVFILFKDVIRFDLIGQLFSGLGVTL